MANGQPLQPLPQGRRAQACRPHRKGTTQWRLTATSAAILLCGRLGATVVQAAVRDLLSIGGELTDALETPALANAERSVKSLVQPLSRDDIAALLSLLPANGDSAYGLNWVILHAIEAAPAWPLWDLLADPQHGWEQRLRTGLANAGQHPPV